VITPAIVPWRSDAALALSVLGDPARARALADEELALARRLGSPRPLGLALRAHTLVHGASARRRGLAEAVAVLREAASPVELSRGLLDLGLQELRDGERDAGRASLREALDLADRHGAGRLAARAETELRVAGGRPRRRRTTGRDSLTAAELRVAGLAVAGRSNREIAAELFLTRKTVETHLSHVYLKLSVAGRSGLQAALAVLTEAPMRTPPTP
jgi:DNA-binding CsgD family transcriptional regulator